MGERIATDYLSCRLQFNQFFPHGVRHPVEILEESYEAYGSLMGAVP